MKLETPFFLVLLVIFIFASIAIVIGDFSTNYPEVGGNVTTEYGDQYGSYVSDVNKSFSGISSKLEAIQTESTGWKIFSTIIVIPQAIISVITTTILSIPMLSTMAIDVATTFKVPQSLVSIAIVAIIGGIIFMLVKFLNKTPQST